MSRSTLIPFAGIAVIRLLFRYNAPSTRVKSLIGFWPLVAGFLLLALPAIWLRLDATGRWSLIPTSGGINFYIGNHPERSSMMNVRIGRA